MSASKGSTARSLPPAVYSPLTSDSLEPQSSLNSALRDASSVAESRLTEDEEGGTSELQPAEEGEVAPSYLNENGRKRGDENKTLNGSKRSQIPGGIEGLSSQLSPMGSVPMEDLSEEDEMASTSDSEPFESSDLELIEAALRNFRSVEGDLQSVEGEIEGSKTLEHDLLGSRDLQDMQDVARLLKKVQAVKSRKGVASFKHVTQSLGGSFAQEPSVWEDMEPADVRQVVQAAAQTALAAAKTAETVVSSLNRNSQAMEELCKALTGSNSLQLSMEEAGKEEGEDQGEQGKFLAIELQQTEIAKSLVRQNRVTHWVLGFIVVSSLVWRYGVVKFVKKVNNTISNPFQGITDMFMGQKEQIEKDNNMPQFKFPGVKDSDEDQNRGVPQEQEDSNFNFGSIFAGLNGGEEAVQRELKAPKEKEGRKFNLGSIFPGLNGNKEAEQRKAEQLKQKAAKEKEGRKFNLGSIFSGLNGEEKG